MKVYQIVVLFCVIALAKGTIGAAVANKSAPVPVSIEAAAASFNNPSDLMVSCNEYSNGYCYLYVYANRTHPRFTPMASNSSAITRVSLSGRVYVLAEDICDAFPNVEYLGLGYATIEQILPGAFDKCKKVTEISLNGNNIRSLPRETFRYNMQLNNLYLEDCKLKELDSWLFTSLFNLSYLNLRNNYLTEFPADLVKTNKELKTLNLDNNDILDLDETKLVEYLPNLGTVYISNNQLSCDRLQQIRAYLQGSSVYLANYSWGLRKRFYLRDTLDDFLCLPAETWLNVYNQHKALKNADSSYKVSIGGLRP